MDYVQRVMALCASVHPHLHKTAMRTAFNDISEEMAKRRGDHIKPIEQTLALSALGADWTAEHRFHSVRRWRFDFANVSAKLAIEIDGGVWSYGRHNRASGYIKDMEKFNHATYLNWYILKYTKVSEMIGDIDNIKKLVEQLTNSEKA